VEASARTLDAFSVPARAWFEAAFAEPTPAQAGAWRAIRAGEDALVVAPTGSGKTLAAFFSAIDDLAATEPPEDPMQRCRVLYVSPLKALAVDVERNLRAPLVGIRRTAAQRGLPEPEITIGVRSGDTSAADRRRLAAHPPDILITTPESLFLILTSRARESLRSVRTVILDEVHAVAGTKRGAHLAVSLERLDALLPRPAQRIGLSATVRPLDEVARFLSGSRQATVVAPAATKTWELDVVVPVEDMTNLAVPVVEVAATRPSRDPLEPHAAGPPRPTPSLWPHIEERVVDLIERHRSTIVFVNSRRLAERLTARLNEIVAERHEQTGPPAHVMAQSGQTYGAPRVIARAHHGSVSKEERAHTEEALKRGDLPCVVATSSLELGIDMGAVDLVVQIESPPSVASALQRVGRAGHQVGEVSRGVLFPKHRRDLIATAVAVERMREGAIESLHVPRNPLDVLAQQIVACCAVDAWPVDDLYALVRGAASFQTLPRSAFEATLDLLAGRYPSDEFAELRPRIVWDRVAGTVSGRPGAQRLAVTSGGTIPDRGLYGVFLAGERASRVGELDEEMVYESRVGDVFSLGASSWRIEDITHDRVVVSPAPGQPGRLPFWKGDQLGRPAELGRAIGRFTREVAVLDRPEAERRCAQAGLDDWATGNLLALLGEQAAATRVVPSDQQLLVERFRDELGDWRVVLHSPYGNQVNAPWALAVARRLEETHGVGAQALSSDDGIVLRIPDTDREPPGAEVFVFDPDEIESTVTDEIGGSALFAARFRECAARALLLPRRDPGRRAPLWQQRQRAAQLLQVAVKFPSFPIVLESVREVLQDVYDVPALIELQREIGARRVLLVDVESAQPSPFAKALLFEYVATFVYEGDNPIAERRAAALSLDQGLLAELLGRSELRELLDPDVLAELESELQRTAESRRIRDAEGLADLLRVLGPLDRAEVAQRSVPHSPVPDWVTSLVAARRVIEVTVGGVPRLAAVEDAGRLRDALGVPVPTGTPDAFTEPLPEGVGDPLGDLVSRYARTHGPITTEEVASRFGLGSAVALGALRRLAGEGRLLEGEFRPAGTGSEWCDADVLRRLRRRSLAKVRREVEPVEPAALARFLPSWQGVGSRLRGVDGVLSVIEQLAGCPVPASALESLVLPARVQDYQPAWLDELTSSGEVVWAGRGRIAAHDGWVSLHPAGTAALTLPAAAEADLSPLAVELLGRLSSGGGWFARQLAEQLPDSTETEIVDSLWELAWASRISNDTFAPVRGLIAGSSTSHRARRPPPRARILGRRVAVPAGPTAAGRWSLLPGVESDPTRRATAISQALLDRHGVVTRGAVVAEQVPGGFAGVYRLLSAFEEAGRCRRGYFVATLGAAQFAGPGAVDRLRAQGDLVQGSQVGQVQGDEKQAVALAATDPANPFGAALAWPDSGTGHRAGRKAGAVVVLVSGHLAVYVERGGRTMLTFASSPESLTRAFSELAALVRRGGAGPLTVKQVDGAAVLDRESAALRTLMEAAGFATTPAGMRLRA
jgi:ATP-dependent Lhr-like helicase